ncbi:GHKL domain-containing protein [Flavobacterium sp. F-328]|uniref:histidine kinase n=1 Tax=Flavobacterium erciyesense TaxID=2825842 RepID=A0ABS5D4W6_9FLAO|nr:ATP-binding protein [Flavobacterium erciyesense]MBQ0909036.1 GHKL domain-containing protein [Flavobacterium erciyesense]
MITPQIHHAEFKRLQVLESYSILDTLPEEDYDNLAAIASQICDTPIAIIGFIDANRHWFKSRVGTPLNENSRDYSFCGHAINDNQNIFIVPDARVDDRFQDNPITKGEAPILFYAGVSLIDDATGLPVGTICVLDHQPKNLSEGQINSLQALSRQTMKLLELRANKLKLEKNIALLEKKNQDLERFSYSAAHDLKSPLSNISGLSTVLIESYENKIDGEAIEVIGLIKSSALKLKEMIDNLLVISKAESVADTSNDEVLVATLETELKNLLSFEENCKIVLSSNVVALYINKTILEQILLNLISNAIKYNNKENIQITISINAEADSYIISVQDNGLGILPEHQKIIFDEFEVVAEQDRFGEKGSGIGLATVKRLVDAYKGTIQVSSEIGKGSLFTFNLPRLK